MFHTLIKKRMEKHQEGLDAIKNLTPVKKDVEVVQPKAIIKAPFVEEKNSVDAIEVISVEDKSNKNKKRASWKSKNE